MEARVRRHVRPLRAPVGVNHLHPPRIHDGQPLQRTRNQVTPRYVCVTMCALTADRSFWFGVIAAFCSGITFGFLTFTGLAARRGEPWAAGRSARRARRHKRTLSGRVVSVPEGTPIPPEQVVTVGEVVAAHQPDEQSPLLAGHEDAMAAGGGQSRATGSAV